MKRNKQPISKKQRKASRFYCQVVRPLWKQGQKNNEAMRARNGWR